MNTDTTTTSTNEVATSIMDLDGNMVTMTPEQVAAIVKRIGILTGGISGWMGVAVEPGPGWMANVGDDKRLIYDLGLAAALLRVQNGQQSITGVIAHEIAHLRDTDVIKFPRGVKDKALAHHMLNLVEDKRIEVIMAREFPGMESPIRSLRKALESPKMQDLMAKVPPHHQLLNAIYGILWDSRVVPAHPKAREAFEDIAPTIEALVEHWRTMDTDPLGDDYMTTNDLMKKLVKAGLYDKLVELKALTPEEQQERDEQEQGEQGAPGDEESEAGGEGEGEEGDDEEGDSAGGSGDSEDGEDGNESGASGAGQGDSEDDGSGTGDDGMPSKGEIASLPQDQRERMEEALREAMDNGLLNEEEQEAAEDLLNDMQDVAEQVRETSKTIDQLLDEAAKGPDDRMLQDDFVAYNSVDDGTWEHSATLGQRFASILRENARDRWSNIGHRSGKRIHERNLPFARTGRDDVFRQRTRLKNRNYVVTLVCDVSGSMRGERIEAATAATVMAGEALELVQGVEFGVYMFGSRTACLKPLHLPLMERRGKIGALVNGTHSLGGSTMMVNAIQRAAEEQLRFTNGNADVEHLIIVLTDGRPSDGTENVKELVTRLERGRGVNGRDVTAPVKVVGVGIQTDFVKSIFPEWTSIKQARDLPAALEGVLRSNIRKSLR